MNIANTRNALIEIKITCRATLLLALGFSPVCLAQSPAGSDEALNNYIRVVYDADNPAPDEIYLPSFLEMLRRASSDPEMQEFFAIQLQTMLEISSSREAHSILGHLINLRASYEQEQTAEYRRAMCPLDNPRPSGKSVYEIMNALDDYNDVLGSKYLDSVRLLFGDEMYPKFLVWMNQYKGGFRLTRLNHRIAYKNRDPDVVLQDVCSRFDSFTSQ